MACALTELPFFPLLFLPEEFTLSQLPFFSEDGVENNYLPPRPSSVCAACWEGPFAMRFGLPLMSPRSGQWYRRWPEEISYVTTLGDLIARADAGCVWCALNSHDITYTSPKYYPRKARITVRGTSETHQELSGWCQSHQTFTSEINDVGDRSKVFGHHTRTHLIYAAPGAPGAYSTGMELTHNTR